MLLRSRVSTSALVGLCLALLVGGVPAKAQEGELPRPVVIQGLPAGPFYIVPFVGLGVSGETNPFYQPQSDTDVVSRANVSLAAILPFRNSYFMASYDGVFRRFRRTPVTNPDSHDFVAELSLLFSTFDRLVLRADRTSGASEVLRFDGGETTYDGTPFRYDVYTAGAERDEAGHLGYAATLVWNSLEFDQTDVNFFNFRGYDATGDVHVPVSPNLWIVGGAAARRYDHMRTTDPPGTVFRKEQADELRVGVRGILAREQEYRAVLEYDDARYPGGTGSDFRGLLADARLVLAPGPATSVSIAASRRRWSSFYGDNNYYLANAVGASVRHRWTVTSDAGASLSLGTAAYPDPDSNGVRRHDRTLSAEVYGTLALHERVGIRVSYAAQLRRSNVEDVGYTAQTVTVQLVLGWR